MELTAAIFGLGGPNVDEIKLPFGGTRRRCSELFPDKNKKFPASTGIAEIYLCGSAARSEPQTRALINFGFCRQICLCRPKKYTPKTYLRQPRKVAKIGHFFVKNRDSFERRFSTPRF
jgi:hypothetical protein